MYSYEKIIKRATTLPLPPLQQKEAKQRLYFKELLIQQHVPLN